jgi:alcohol dehydrogenase (quinone), cytochrome c subunit
MKPWAIFAVRVIAVVVLLCIIGAVGAYVATILLGGVGGDRAAKLDEIPNQHLIERGAYIAVLGDCAACHTAPQGPEFAGGLAIATPIGAVYTTNITPDKATGVGNYTFGDFERAVRRGIRPDGSALYPAMPFPSYARVSDADMKALYAYFMNGVRPVARPDKAPDIPWPLSMRWPLTYWRWMFAPAVQSASVAASDDTLRDRGSYLVEGLEHCGTCHTPRGLGLEEKALTDKGGPQYLAGGFVDNAVANNLRGDPLTGLGSWSEADIVQFLSTGRNARTAVFAGMSDVVTHSTQSLRDEDLHAIAHFIKTLPGSDSERSFSFQPAVGAALASGDVSRRGALDYLNNCAACHLSSGEGYHQTFPALAGNPVVNAPDPASLIRIVLSGGAEPATAKAPTHFTMPAFGERMTDQEVADVLSFVRSSWGNDAPPVDSARVARLRAILRAPTPAAQE